jgi:hypothetical protein
MIVFPRSATLLGGCVAALALISGAVSAAERDPYAQFMGHYDRVLKAQNSGDLYRLCRSMQAMDGLLIEHFAVFEQRDPATDWMEVRASYKPVLDDQCGQVSVPQKSPPKGDAPAAKPQS